MSAFIELEPDLNKFLKVVAAPNPFKAVEPVYLDNLRVGMTLAEVLEVVQPDIFLRRHAHVFINDHYIPRNLWHVVKPKAHALISIRVVPPIHGGGGGKNPLRTILSIAIVVAAFAFGAPVGAALFGAQGLSVAGFTITAAQIGGAIISAVGTLLLNALSPVKPAAISNASSDKRESPTLSISGASNQARPYEPVPVIFGRHKLYPAYGASPYTEIVGNDQYLRLVFVWGHGPLKIEDLKIGNTPLDEFEGVEYVNRAGYITDPDLTLYTQDVFEETLSIVCTEEGGSQVRLTGDDADEIAVDFVFGKGLVTYNTQGKRTNRTVAFDVEYALDGTEDWVGAGTSFSSRTSPTMDSVENTTYVLKQGVSPQLAERYKRQGRDISFYADQVQVRNGTRYDIVVLDRFTGAIEIIKGVEVYNNETPVAPVVPATKVALARIAHQYGSTISAGDITDLRTSDAPFSVPATDFAVSATGPASMAVTVAAGSLNAGKTQTVTAKTAEAKYHTVRFSTPTRGKYKVRVTRTTADSTSDQTFDELTWGVIRTITNEAPFDAAGLATTELRIKATDQLNQVIDQFSGVVTSILHDWNSDTEEWEVRPTQNPAAMALACLQGQGNGNPLDDNRINWESFQEYHEYCTSKNFTFNMVRDFQTSVWDALVDVTSGSFAVASQVDNKWGIVIDKDRTVPANHFTPKNTKNFTFSRQYPTRPHAWRIRFVDEENDFRQDEMTVYDDGYDETNASIFETFEVVGVTNRDHVWKVGRRRIAEARLRCESYTFMVDFENLLCVKGSMVYITHDAISQGLASGRIKAVNVESGYVVSLEIDEKIEMQAGYSYGIAIRNVDEITITGQVLTIAGTNITTLILANPIPEANAPEVGDLYGFGYLGSETLECVVTSIKPVSNMAANVKCVPLARPIFSAETGAIPNFTPNISTAAGYTTPFITNIRSDETVLSELPNGLLTPTMRITFGRFSSSLINRPLGVELQYKEENDEAYKSIFMLKQEVVELDIPNLVQGSVYKVRARYTLTNGTGPWSAEQEHTIVGMSTLPPDVTNLWLEGDFLRWSFVQNVPKDFKGFEVRTSTNTDADWENMTQCHDGFLKSSEINISNLPRGLRVYAVKAVDLADNYSDLAKSLVRDFGDLIVENVVETIDHAAEGFLGVITGGAVVMGVLEANDLTTYLPNDAGLYLQNGSDLYLPDQFDEMTYTTIAVKATADYVPSRLSVDVEYTGTLTIYYRVGVDPLYLPEGAELYLPEGDDEYLPYTYADDYRLFPTYIDVAEDEVYQFKLVMNSDEDQTSISAFDVIFDVVDESEGVSDLVLSSGGTRVPLTKDYRSVKIVNVTLHAGSAATRIVIVDKDAALGPLLQGYDAAGVAAAATVDVTIQGVKG